VTDAQLIHAYRSGDQSAFEQLYERYRKPVFAYLNRMLPGQRAMVDDLFQQTWIKVIDKLDSYRDNDRFIAYILRVARNQAIDVLRRAGREVAVDPGQIEACDQGVGPEGEALNREIVVLLERAVAQLSPDQREVFLMRQAEISFKEIAAIQKVSINTALGRMRYALDKLRVLLTEAGVTV